MICCAQLYVALGGSRNWDDRGLGFVLLVSDLEPLFDECAKVGFLQKCLLFVKVHLKQCDELGEQPHLFQARVRQ